MFKKVNRENRFAKMVVRYLEQKIREKLSLLVKDNLKSPSLVLRMRRARVRAKERETVETQCNGQQQVSALGELQ